jgi:hypothetical protein
MLITFFRTQYAWPNWLWNSKIRKG